MRQFLFNYWGVFIFVPSLLNITQNLTVPTDEAFDMILWWQDGNENTIFYLFIFVRVDYEISDF